MCISLKLYTMLSDLSGSAISGSRVVAGRRRAAQVSSAGVLRSRAPREVTCISCPGLVYGRFGSGINKAQGWYKVGLVLVSRRLRVGVR